MATPHSSTAPTEEFPQPYSGHCLDNLLSLVSEISARADALAQQVPLEPVLENCEYADPEGSWPCYHPAVVTQLESEQSLCARHFRRMEYGR